MKIKAAILKLTERIRDLWHEREYFWRYHLGWMPVQPCMNCGRWFWGGLPRWWWMGEDGKWGMTWKASWCDFCSRECADQDLEMLKEFQIAEYGSERMRIEIDLGNGDVCATSVPRDITPEELQDIKNLAIIGAEGYGKKSPTEGTPCKTCRGTKIDPAGIWDVIDCEPLDFCRECNGSGRDLNAPPCGECGAMSPAEAYEKCNCAGDKDWCHGCVLWPE